MRHLGLIGFVALATLAFGPAAARSSQAATTVKVNEMTVDGFTVMAVDCTVSGGGFMAGAVLIGALAKSKKAFDKCGPKGEAARLSFVLSGKRIKDVKVVASSKPGVGKCQAKVLRKKVTSKLEGRCAMTLLSGPKAAAKKAAAGLAQAP